jgi:hypothetical protein
LSMAGTARCTVRAASSGAQRGEIICHSVPPAAQRPFL